MGDVVHNRLRNDILVLRLVLEGGLTHDDLLNVELQ